ncbi:MAG TPA: peptidylprolyl isomerase [Candidatus Limnocylindrales bacterium]
MPGRRPKDARRTLAGRTGVPASRVSGGRTSGGTTMGGMPVDPRVIGAAVIGAIIIVAAIGFTVLGGGTGSSAAPSDNAAACPTSQPAPLARGDVRTVSIDTPKGTIVITVKGSLSPIATGNFIALASCGYYDGVVFHRTPTLQSGAPFVIQGGDGQYGRTGSLDLGNVGQGGPGYTIADEPITTTFHRGTVAMARGQDANSEGSQFFIVLSDSAGPILQGANPGYAIIGDVASGLSVADAIFQASGGAELPSNPIPMTSVTVSTPSASPGASAPITSPAAS